MDTDDELDAVVTPDFPLVTRPEVGLSGHLAGAVTAVDRRLTSMGQLPPIHSPLKNNSTRVSNIAIHSKVLRELNI